MQPGTVVHAGQVMGKAMFWHEAAAPPRAQQQSHVPAFPSLQSAPVLQAGPQPGILVPAQTFAVQASPVVQTSPSSHFVPVVTATYEQYPYPGPRVHTSVVQALLSLHTAGVNTHFPLTHLSVVQTSLSVQSAVTVQVPGVQPGMAVWVHAPVVPQASAVQALLSSQFTGAPPQTFAVQTSPVVQALPSSQVVPSFSAAYEQ